MFGTKLMILNCLEIEPMSVYDIKVWMSNLDVGKWGNVLIGSIQNAVLTLEKANAIEVLRVEINGKRKKTIYRMNEEGQKIQKEFIRDALSSLDLQYASTFFLGLSAINKISDNEKIELIEKRKHKLMLEKETLHHSIEDKKNYTILDEVQKLSIDCMFSTIEVQLELVEKLLELWRNENED